MRYSLPTEGSLEQTFLNNRFWFGPAYYKEIEWLEFPRLGKPLGQENIPATHFEQDVNGVVEYLTKFGQWPLEDTPQGYRLYGHR
ncbi:hypothetical protein [Alteromonas confluentis]|uniref:hypothetical protein n=1 Tax=Alteromonas confluentis TaxID=1656094 RepID=UPI001112D90E|nr:hypothetical protein [Alteromonas confluentis]